MHSIDAELVDVEVTQRYERRRVGPRQIGEVRVFVEETVAEGLG